MEQGENLKFSKSNYLERIFLLSAIKASKKRLGNGVLKTAF